MRCLGIGIIAAGCSSCSSSNGSPSAAPPPVQAKAAAAAAAAPATCPMPVRALGAGITHERVDVGGVPAIETAEDCLDVVRIDPAGFRLTAATALSRGRAWPLPAWLDREGAIAGINAGMFHDNQRSVGMLVVGDEANNPDDNERFGGYLAWDPVDPASAPIAVFGRDCPGFDLPVIRARYRAITQSYRLLDCEGDPIAWKDPKAYSAAAVGVDRDGMLVLLHARAPHRMSELAATAARLDLAGAIFVEGGPEASLIVHGGDGSVARVGSFETGFLERDDNGVYWELPNVLLVMPARVPEK